MTDRKPHSLCEDINAIVSKAENNLIQGRTAVKNIIDRIDSHIEQNKESMDARETDLLYAFRNANAMFLAGNSIEESIKNFDDVFADIKNAIPKTIPS